MDIWDSSISRRPPGEYLKKTIYILNRQDVKRNVLITLVSFLVCFF